MSYKQSRARRAFDAGVKSAVAEALNIQKSSVVRTATNNSSRLLGAYFVLVFAQLENYIREIVEDSVAAVNLHSPMPINWPETMLGYAIHQGADLRQRYRNFAYNEDEGAVISSLGQFARAIISPPPASYGILLDAAHILEKKKYPSPKNLPQLFRRVGIPDIFKRISKIARTDGKLILTTLNDLRTVIAHSGTIPPSFSARDFRDRIRQMSIFVSALDKVIASHFCQFLRRNKWNAFVA